MRHKIQVPAGLYTIDPFDVGPRGGDRSGCYDALVTVVGLGGTGTFLAEDLARLLSVHFLDGGFA